ncbi:MAG: hypothetical protein QW632_01555 [Ignisphaera sp.]
MSIVTLLETVVHEHSRHLRKSRRIRLEPLDNSSAKTFEQYVRKLKNLSQKLGATLHSIAQYNLKELDQESLAKLDLLTFFIYEVSTTEEIEFWSRLETYRKSLTSIEIAIDKEIERVSKIKDLAKYINAHVQSLLKEV